MPNAQMKDDEAVRVGAKRAAQPTQDSGEAANKKKKKQQISTSEEQPEVIRRVNVFMDDDLDRVTHLRVKLSVVDKPVIIRLGEAKYEEEQTSGKLAVIFVAAEVEVKSVDAILDGEGSYRDYSCTSDSMTVKATGEMPELSNDNFILLLGEHGWLINPAEAKTMVHLEYDVYISRCFETPCAEQHHIYLECMDGLPVTGPAMTLAGPAMTETWAFRTSLDDDSDDVEPVQPRPSVPRPQRLPPSTIGPHGLTLADIIAAAMGQYRD